MRSYLGWMRFFSYLGWSGNLPPSYIADVVRGGVLYRLRADQVVVGDLVTCERPPKTLASQYQRLTDTIIQNPSQPHGVTELVPVQKIER